MAVMLKSGRSPAYDPPKVMASTWKVSGDITNSKEKKKHQEIHDALNLGLFFFLYGKLGPLADSIRGRRLAPDLRFSKKMEFLKHLDDVIVEEW